MQKSRSKGKRTVKTDENTANRRVFSFIDDSVSKKNKKNFFQKINTVKISVLSISCTDRAGTR